MTTSEQGQLFSAVQTLIDFEEKTAAYYGILADRCAKYSEFWDSGSLAKQTRANLYTNLQADIKKYPIQYNLRRGITGYFMSMKTKLEQSIGTLEQKNEDISNHTQFLFDVETAICAGSMLPIINGQTPDYKKISLILEKIQNNQHRLIDALLKKRDGVCSQA